MQPSSRPVTMPKEAIVRTSIEAVEIVEIPVPTPKDKEIVIKVIVSGTKPKDWKYPLWAVFQSSISHVLGMNL